MSRIRISELLPEESPRDLTIGLYSDLSEIEEYLSNLIDTNAGDTGFLEDLSELLLGAHNMIEKGEASDF